MKYSAGMSSPSAAQAQQDRQLAQAEAARYALLRRLAPAMRHHLVVNLQPIGMLHEVLDRRLRAAEPDLAHLKEGVHKINSFARAALHASTDMVTWLAPDPAAVCTAEEGVRECLGLVATNLGFRGFALHDEAGPVTGTVGRGALRCLLTAGLLQLTDEAAPPAEVLLRAQALAQGLELSLQLRPGGSNAGFPVDLGYRALQRADLQALAQAEGVALEREDGGIRLVLPWQQARPPA